MPGAARRTAANGLQVRLRWRCVLRKGPDECPDQLGYTVGEIYEVKSAAKGDPHARFRYSIDGITYTNTVGIETRNRKLLIGKCYVISIPVGHEGSGSLLWEHSVPPGKIAPPEGWKKLPSFD